MPALTIYVGAGLGRVEATEMDANGTDKTAAGTEHRGAVYGNGRQIWAKCDGCGWVGMVRDYGLARNAACERELTLHFENYAEAA
jgi:hypothetical protein